MSSSRSVAVTGGLGNLGTKLLLQLARTSPCPLLIGLDVRAPSSQQLQALQAAAAQNRTGATPAVELLECDLTDPHDSRWRDALQRVQSVVHFAACNPYPDASWDDAAISIDITLNVALAAADSPSLERFVFATSNHVMGRYKDDPLAATVGPGTLRPDRPLGVGTVWEKTEPPLDATAYSTTKMVGERICQALGTVANGSTTFVSVRIGWCQPGANLPETLNATGEPSAQTAAPPNPTPTRKDTGGPNAGSALCGCRTGTLRTCLNGPSTLTPANGRRRPSWSTACPTTRAWPGAWTRPGAISDTSPWMM